MAELLRGPTGPVTRHLIERATIVQAAAKSKAPRRTGCLQDSIVKRVEDTPEGVNVRIIADTTPCSPTRTSYAYWIEMGTPPHDIRATNASVLAFDWNGEKVFVKEVHHPGTRAYRFMRDALPLAVA
jgi:hypothetical protein